MEIETVAAEEAQPEQRVPRRKKLPPVTWIGVGLLLVLLIAAVAIVISGKTKQKTGADASAVYAVNADAVVQMAPYSSGVALLTANSLEYVDPYGNLMNASEHTFSNPVMVTAGKNLILYDRGGNALRIDKNAVKYKQIEFESAVSCADITGAGTYAYVLNADGGYQSHLFAYSYKGALLFEWSSADYVLSVTVSPNGKYAAVGVLSVDNAEVRTRVEFFNFSKNEPVYTVDFSGETVYDLEFVSAKKLVVLTDRGAYAIAPDGEKTVLCEYAANEMNHTELCKDGLGVAAVNLYGNNNNALVRIFDKGCRNVFEREYTETVVSVRATQNYAAVVTGSEIHVLDGKNVLTGKLSPGETCMDCCISGSRIYVLTASGLHNYNLHES